MDFCLAAPSNPRSRVSVVNDGGITTRGELAHGILAQSIGGGGGSGGISFAAAVHTGLKGYFTFAVGGSMGGAGGKGVDGGTVAVTNAGNLETFGKGSHAIMAQSVGGGGGAGGFAGSFAGGFSGGARVGLAIGGEGGTGGDANRVTVRSTGSSIRTHEVGSYGVFAQSVGGGGGDGGNSLAVGLGLATGDAGLNLSVGVGGKGGTGGKGAGVVVENTSMIETEGQVSHGIAAQSVGGGGGNGGWTGAGAFSFVSGSDISVSIGKGGDAGDGGSGGDVSVSNSGGITTKASVIGTPPDFTTNLATKVPELPLGAIGILAQSIGGGGGNAGLAVAVAASFGSDGKGQGSVDFGGNGGAGNFGGRVAVTNSGVIETAGEHSHGILAQSIGGGGGNGGSAIAIGANALGPANVWAFNVGFAMGGGGGNGNVGGAVSVRSTNDITTAGASAHGIFAQSVGGGGGAGGAGLAITAGLNTKTQNVVNASVAVGGAGGNGNHGGAVDVVNSGKIETSGDGAYGIFGQSVGGGGGAGGNGRALTVMVDVNDWKKNKGGYFDGLGKTWNVAVGGSGGGASDGGIVSVTNVGSIKTRGADAYGILAQSVGGGGGLGGTAEHGLPLEFLGKVGDIEVGDIIDVITEFTPLKGFTDLQIVVGGSGGSSGNGSNAIVKNTGTIETLGDGAHGIVAQSVGGGGGIGGKGAVGLVGKVGVGGAGGTAGNGGNVTVIQSGDITTSGVDANGITAQSVGGGGGMGGNVDRGIGNFGINAAFGNGGGNGGNGGTVTVTSDGHITTSNSASYGIFAQSVGGGGGVVGSLGNLDSPYLLSFAGSTGGHGDGGAVKVTHSGDITTYGTAADGIFAQSVGGTNKAGVALGVGGTVDITVTGDITAHGTDANGISAQSTGTKGASNITINILGGGTVHGGSGDSAGVRIEGGANNTLTNRGTITTLNGATGVAIRGGSGNERVENYGTLVGQVLLGGGVNSWNNHPGSIFNAETTFDLGVGNTFDNKGMLNGNGEIIGNVVNAGMISPGNSAGSLTIGGDLTLLPEANMTFEIGGRQQGSSYDFVRVTNFVQFAGTLSLSLNNNFRPTATDTFTLMEFGSGSGLFGNVLNGGRLLTLDNLASFQVSYNANSLQVSGYQSPDTDGDGMSDYDESLAGTDWLDAGSVLRITSLTRDSSGHMVIRFPRVAGRHYSLQYTHDLRGGVWEELWWPAFTFPDTNTCQWVDDGTQTGGLTNHNCFYRVKVQLTAPAEVGLGASIQRDAFGHMILQFMGAPGNHYAVQYTTNLTSGAWTPVPAPVFTFPSLGRCQWIDDGTLTGGLGGPARFYRVRQQPP
jgi:hypothetical protein